MRFLTSTLLASLLVASASSQASEGYCILSQMRSDLEPTDLITMESVKNGSDRFPSQSGQYILSISVSADKKLSATVVENRRVLTRLHITEASESMAVTAGRADVVLNSDGSGLVLTCNMKSGY